MDFLNDNIEQEQKEIEKKISYWREIETFDQVFCNPWNNENLFVIRDESLVYKYLFNFIDEPKYKDIIFTEKSGVYVPINQSLINEFNIPQELLKKKEKYHFSEFKSLKDWVITKILGTNTRLNDRGPFRFYINPVTKNVDISATVIDTSYKQHKYINNSWEPLNYGI